MDVLDEVVLLPLEKKPRIEDEVNDSSDSKEEKVNDSSDSKEEKVNDSSDSKEEKVDDSSDSSSSSESESDLGADDPPHYSFDDDDDEMCSYDKISDEDFERYLQEVKVSEGYDVSTVSDPFPGCIQPLYLCKEIKSDVTRFLLPSIDKYNIQENTELKLVKLVSVNTPWDLSGLFYVTFKAKDGDEGDPKTYQARLLLCFDGSAEIEQFRLKPPAAAAE